MKPLEYHGTGPFRAGLFDLGIEPYLKDQETYSTSAQVLLANTYALAGDSATASTIRIKMNQSDLKK